MVLEQPSYVAKHLSRPVGASGQPRRIVGLAAAAVGLLALLGVVIYLVTDRGRREIRIQDPGALVRVDGRVVSGEELREPITLRAGEHELSITWSDGATDSRRFPVLRGQNEPLPVSHEPRTAARPGA